MKVVLFCGGRGNSNLIKALIDSENVDLTLIVNAYDNGLSTGEIRRLVPGMLGPSDFRKNLSHLLVPASRSHVAFGKFLEHRIYFNEENSRKLLGADPDTSFRNLGSLLIEHDLVLKDLFKTFSNPQRQVIRELLSLFLEETDKIDSTRYTKDLIKFQGFALGNLLFAGAYILNDRSFSKATDYLCSIFEIAAKIINVSDKNLFLIGLTSLGEVISSEEDIVAGNFHGKVSEIFLLPEPLTTTQRKDLESIGKLSDKIEFLLGIQELPMLNSDAVDALEAADIVIYGSGTQNSSLLPSYKVLSNAGVFPSSTSCKIFIANLDYDLDILNWTDDDLIESFSKQWKTSFSDLVDVIITDNRSPFQFSGASSGSSEIIKGQIRNLRDSVSHDGIALKELILKQYQFNSRFDCNLVILVDSNDLGTSNMARRISEFDFSRAEIPCEYEIVPSRNPSEKSVELFNTWCSNSDASRFLVLYACEGETRVEDLISGISFMLSQDIDVLNCSRTQARRQWMIATGRTYGEGIFRFGISFLASMFAVIFSMLRRKQLLTDPLSRCLIIDRTGLSGVDQKFLRYSGVSIPGLRTHLLKIGLNVAEIPIRYRVFKGYRSYSRPTKDAIRGFIEIMRLPN
jgi:2-phospho-L-lactate transferase/gluconeogenesis factor (CofD/UPF0052 family)